jgi:hypothetical protein
MELTRASSAAAWIFPYLGGMSFSQWDFAYGGLNRNACSLVEDNCVVLRRVFANHRALKALAHKILGMHFMGGK